MHSFLSQLLDSIYNCLVVNSLIHASSIIDFMLNRRKGHAGEMEGPLMFYQEHIPSEASTVFLFATSFSLFSYSPMGIN